MAPEWVSRKTTAIRKAKFYRITRAGRKQLQAEERQWRQTAGIMARFFALKGDTP